MTLLIASMLLAVTAAPQSQAMPLDLSPPADAERLPDGLVTYRVAPGRGTDRPQADDLVKMRYSMWNPEGKLVDSIGGSRAGVMQVSRMMPGWREAVQMMVVGEKRRTWIPASLGDGKIREGSSLIVDTELLEVVHGVRTPPDVAAPPPDAEHSRSGLTWKVLAPGTGDRHPTPRSTVVVNYSGWTTDGRLFDSTVLHGKPASFPLNGVIKGWTEGIPLMKVGEIRRFWIPAKLAYGDDPTKPQGMLVFDVQLLEIE